MHSGGLELTQLTYSRHEDNLLHHRGDRIRVAVVILLAIFSDGVLWLGGKVWPTRDFVSNGRNLYFINEGPVVV